MKIIARHKRYLIISVYIYIDKKKKKNNCDSDYNHMKNSVDRLTCSHDGRRSNTDISISLRPRIVGSVNNKPRGLYILSFCSHINFDTLRKHFS